MTTPATPAFTMLQRQLAELDAIENETVTMSMNTVRGSEEVSKWKARTVPLIAQHVGQQAAQRFADTKPGPSFTNDLFEEFSDEVDVYRTALRGVMKDLQQAGPRSNPA